MAAELVLFVQGARALTSAITQYVQDFRRGRTARRTELKSIVQQADALLRQEHARLSGHLARVHVEEIAITARHLEAAQLQGHAHEMGLRQLEILSQKLMANLDGFNA